MSQRDRLRSLLQERSLRFGDFTLVSGRKSSYYFDSKQTTLDPEGAYLTAWCILDLVRREGIDAAAIGGMTLGADPMVCAVAPLSLLEDGPKLPAFIVRKEAKGHGTQNQAMHPQPVSELLHYMPKPDRYSLVRNLFAASSFVMRMLGPS